MAYMLLIVEPRGQRAARSEAEGRAVYAQMVGFAEELKRRGVLMAVESLLADDRAARVAVRSGRSITTDGPFSEAKEMVGGFFLLDVEDRDAALAIAAQCPAAQWATVEVRETGPCFA